jgi:hypothetical protein
MVRMKTDHPKVTVFTDQSQVLLKNSLKLEIVWEGEHQGEEEGWGGDQEGGPHPPGERGEIDINH